MEFNARIDFVPKLRWITTKATSECILAQVGEAQLHAEPGERWLRQGRFARLTDVSIAI